MDLSNEKYIIQSKEEAMSDISFGGATYEEYGVIKTDKFITNPEDLRKIIFLKVILENFILQTKFKTFFL